MISCHQKQGRRISSAEAADAAEAVIATALRDLTPSIPIVAEEAIEVGRPYEPHGKAAKSCVYMQHTRIEPSPLTALAFCHFLDLPDPRNLLCDDAYE